MARGTFFDVTPDEVLRILRVDDLPRDEQIDEIVEVWDYIPEPMRKTLGAHLFAPRQ
jgi:hypothetical protein